MELSASSSLSSLPHRRRRLISMLYTSSSLLLPCTLLPPPKPLASSLYRSLGVGRREVRALSSEEETLAFAPGKLDTAVVDKIEVDEPQPPETTVTGEEENGRAEAVVDDGGFLNRIDLKLDADDTYSILVYGTVALAALWLSSAVISAIDSIPLFPKLMEAVGLAYTIWFSYRYLIFKQNRDELVAKIEELKDQIMGGN